MIPAIVICLPSVMNRIAIKVIKTKRQMGNACTIENQICANTNAKHEEMVSFILAKEIFDKELNLEEQVKDVKKAETLITVIQKVITYNNDNLIQHLINQKDKKSILKFLECWSRLKLQQLDMIYQNILIKNFQTQNEPKKLFKHPKVIKKSNKEKVPEIFQHYINKGIKMHHERQVAIVIFTPQFDNEKQHQNVIKKLGMAIEQILETSNQTKLPIPLIAIVTCASLYIKIKQIMNKLCISPQSYVIVVKRSNLIMDQLGRLCLKANNSPDLIQKSFGNDDFLNLHYEGDSLAKIFRRKNIQFLVALQLDYFIGEAIDYFFWGYYLENFESFDSIYRFTSMTHKKDQNPLIVKQSMGKIYLKNYHEFGMEKTIFDWTQLVSSPTNVKWQGYFIFHLPSYRKILQFPSSVDIKDFIQLRKEKTCYWNPQTKSYQMNKECTFFYKPLSNFFLKLQSNRTCGIQYEPLGQNQKSRKKPSNFDTQFF